MPRLFYPDYRDKQYKHRFLPATLKWEKSRDNVAVKEYRLYRDGEMVYSGAETGYKDSGLLENTVYTYCVMAVDEAGNESEKSRGMDGVVFMPRITAVFLYTA